GFASPPPGSAVAFQSRNWELFCAAGPAPAASPTATKTIAEANRRVGGDMAFLLRWLQQTRHRADVRAGCHVADGIEGGARLLLCERGTRARQEFRRQLPVARRPRRIAARAVCLLGQHPSIAQSNGHARLSQRRRRGVERRIDAYRHALLHGADRFVLE